MEKNKDIFTIGDNTNCGIIKTFEKSGDMIRVYFEDKPINYHVNLKILEHCKQPSFTTEDGVDIFENDIYYVINILGSNGNPNEFKIFRIDLLETINNNDKNCYKCNHIKTFSTKEKAQKYIDLHKPKYSLNDIENCLMSTAITYFQHKVLEDNLKQLNK